MQSSYIILLNSFLLSILTVFTVEGSHVFKHGNQRYNGEMDTTNSRIRSADHGTTPPASRYSRPGRPTITQKKKKKKSSYHHHQQPPSSSIYLDDTSPAQFHHAQEEDESANLIGRQRQRYPSDMPTQKRSTDDTRTSHDDTDHHSLLPPTHNQKNHYVIPNHPKLSLEEENNPASLFASLKSATKRTVQLVNNEDVDGVFHDEGNHEDNDDAAINGFRKLFEAVRKTEKTNDIEKLMKDKYEAESKKDSLIIEKKHLEEKLAEAKTQIERLKEETTEVTVDIDPKTSSFLNKISHSNKLSIPQSNDTTTLKRNNATTTLKSKVTSMPSNASFVVTDGKTKVTLKSLFVIIQGMAQRFDELQASLDNLQNRTDKTTALHANDSKLTKELIDKKTKDVQVRLNGMEESQKKNHKSVIREIENRHRAEKNQMKRSYALKDEQRRKDAEMNAIINGNNPTTTTTKKKKMAGNRNGGEKDHHHEDRMRSGVNDEVDDKALESQMDAEIASNPGMKEKPFDHDAMEKLESDEIVEKKPSSNSKKKLDSKSPQSFMRSPKKSPKSSPKSSPKKSPKRSS
eukprot:g1194.t1